MHSPTREAIRSVTHLVPACRVRSGCQPGLPPTDFHPSAAHALLPACREPENIQCQTGFIQWVMTCGSHRLWAARPTCRRLPAWSNHHKLFTFSLGLSRFGGLGAGGDQPRPFSPVGSGVQTPSPVHDRSPRNPSSCPARRRAWRRRAHLPSSRATRPWPVCRPGPWSR